MNQQTQSGGLRVALFLIALNAAGSCGAQINARVTDTPKRSVECPAPKVIRARLKPLSGISLDTRPRGEMFPPNCFQQFHGEQRSAPLVERNETLHEFNWRASGVFHHPLYFEDVPLERYGHSVSLAAQPAISGVKFLRDVLILPYRVGLDPLDTRIHPLGFARPGSWAPHVKERLPVSLRGAALQGAATSGFIFLFPL